MIDKLLNIERINYKSNSSSQDFKRNLNNILNQGTFKFKYNLAGKFINDNEFKIIDKWTIGVYIRSFENDPAYLRGKIIEKENGITVKVSVRPNSIFPLFGFLFPILGLFAIFTTGFGQENNEGLFVGLFFIVFGIIIFPIGRLLRNRLRNKFEQYLDLKRYGYVH